MNDDDFEISENDFTETFNIATVGIYTSSYVSNIGTYAGTGTSKFAIVAANEYGGAGGTGNYFAIGAESGLDTPVLLTLDAEENYFGFWWSAGDANNSITFLQDGEALATFTTANLKRFCRIPTPAPSQPSMDLFTTRRIITGTRTTIRIPTSLSPMWMLSPPALSSMKLNFRMPPLRADSNRITTASRMESRRPLSET